MQRVRQRATGRVKDCGVKQPCGAGRWRMAAFAFPGVEPDVVVIAAGRNERRARTEALHELEAKHAAIKSERAVEIGDLEMNMPDSRAGNDGWIVGHALSPFFFGQPPRTAEGGSSPHASSDTCPSGKPNSKVFSVIDTIV